MCVGLFGFAWWLILVGDGGGAEIQVNWRCNPGQYDHNNVNMITICDHDLIWYDHDLIHMIIIWSWWFWNVEKRQEWEEWLSGRWNWNFTKVCPNLSWSWPILYLIIPKHTILYHTIPNHSMPFLTIPYYAIPYHMRKIRWLNWNHVWPNLRRSSGFKIPDEGNSPILVNLGKWIYWLLQ